MIPMRILDGPIGTQLIARGIPAPPPLWSATALQTAPQAVGALHREYAQAGACLHTTNTFRTQPRHAQNWEVLARKAVHLARQAGGRVVGSLAPLEDCYRPDLSPPEPFPEHLQLARVLVEEGVDLLLCETFANPLELVEAVHAARTAGASEVWASLTPGYRCELLTPAELAAGAQAAIDAGADLVLANCMPALRALPYAQALAALDHPFGIYANAGDPLDRLGWELPSPDAAERYADLAERWAALGAQVIGGCCGTGPEHIHALHERLLPQSSRSITQAIDSERASS